MAKNYPVKYAVVEKGKVETVIVKDPTHEAAIILKHSEATILSKLEKFDDSRFVIKNK